MESKRTSFWALLISQATGAFNDNFFKIAVGLLVTHWITDPEIQNRYVSFSGLIFVIPFISFTLLAGRLADRLPKNRVIVASKLFELFVIAAAITALHTKNISLLLGGIFLFGLQATFYGPAKYGIIPELVTEKELPRANGFLTVSTVGAILIGTIAATLVSNRLVVLSLVLGAMGTAGFIASLLIGKQGAMNPNQPLAWNPFPDFVANWKLISGNIPLKRAVMATSYFWFAGALLQLNMIVFGKSTLKAPDHMVGVILTMVVIGIALGSMVAARLSKEKIETGIIPIGALGMSLFSSHLVFATHSWPTIFIDVSLLGFSCGIFLIPLEAFIQARSPASDRGRILATVNFLSFVAIMVASGVLWFLGSVLKANPSQILLIFGVGSLIPAIIIAFLIPQALARLLLFLLTNTIYLIRVIGRENVPLQGPALLVPNHISWVDAFLIGGSISRSVRFLMYRDFFEKSWIHPLVKLMEALPISELDSPKEIMRSLLAARKKLEEGRLVGIFPEGRLSLHGGELQEFKKGLEIIIKGLNVPVIPVHLEGVWGSIFSFKDHKFFWKWPHIFPYPITVTFGKPLMNPTTSEVREAVLELGSNAFKIHRIKEPTLFSSFLKQAKCFPRQKISSDSSGLEINNHQLLVMASLFGEKMDALLASSTKEGDSPSIGILLPPSVGAVMANAAAASQGIIPINLNYTQSMDAIQKVCAKAGITKIITSEKLVAKLNLIPQDNFIYIEPLIKGFSKWDKLSRAILLKTLPVFVLERTFFRKANKNLDDIATIMLTSGSTGIPKVVMLTEGNIISKVQSLAMILNLSSKDVFLGILPFFHSFGFTTTLWFPLVAGFKTALHSNPLDSKTIGDLCRAHRATFLMATPTFLSAYIRKVPRENFESLRFAIAGAEKLRPELAKAFEEKYGVPIMEGYGCTELSPVVAINLPDILNGEELHVGRKVSKIGRPIPGVAIKVVDPDTLQSLPEGKPGLLLVKGPNVMKGYYKDSEKTEEVLKDGWYVTGDIATIDEDGFIEITDRLSRFSKIGGEMVPHIMIEKKLHELADSIDRLFVVSSIPDEKKGEALIVLVAGFGGNLDDLYKKLLESGLPKLWVPDRDKFFVIDAIPTLGSGKLDMQAVKRITHEKTMLR